MCVGLSFSATASGFARAFFFGGMVARFLHRGSWMGAEIGAAGGRGEIWGKLVGIGVVWMIGGAHVLTDVARGAGAPVRRLARRGQHGVADCFIELETASTLFGTRRSQYFHFCVGQKNKLLHVDIFAPYNMALSKSGIFRRTVLKL
jgi:hypothetical protein